MKFVNVLFTRLLGAFGCAAIFALVFSAAIIGSFLWPYAINTWLLFLGKTTTVSWWICGLFSLIPQIGWFSVPVAFVTYVIMLFI